MRFSLIIGALGASLAACSEDGSGGGYDENEGIDVRDPEPIGGGDGPVLGGDGPGLGDGGPDAGGEGPARRTRSVYVMSNAAGGNEIISLRPTAQGLVRVGTTPTGGQGLGRVELPDLTAMDGIDPLVSEGALHQRGRHLLAVNAGSRSISSLRVDEEGRLELADVQAVPGHPTSITSRGDAVFVAMSPGLDGRGGVAMLRMRADGELEPTGQILELSDRDAHPSRVLIAGEGRFLVATEVMSDIITVWSLGPNGRPFARTENVSAGIGPFGAAAFGEDHLLVAEAAPMLAGKASISTYRIEEDGTLTPVSEALGNGQSATCWVQITPDERYAYTTNTESGTISIYALDRDGSATLIDGDAEAPGLAPIDASLSASGERLYVLLGGGGSVATYDVEADGSLDEVEISADLGLPLRGTQGILAWRPRLSQPEWESALDVPDHGARGGFEGGVEDVP